MSAHATCIVLVIGALGLGAVLGVVTCVWIISRANWSPFR